ncbi:MAG: rod-binding protein [Pseudomonadota bacterium]
MTDAPHAIATLKSPPNAPRLAPSRSADDASAGDARDLAALEQAKAFEAAFVSQMLKFGGLDETVSAEAGYGGEAFATFMLDALAEQIVERGGFGVAEAVYRQLTEGNDG